MHKFLIEGLDRLGKDTLIRGIQDALGYHYVLHFSKPLELRCYEPCPTGMTAAEMKSASQHTYQTQSFVTMFKLLGTRYTNLICNRAHLGECVYAPLYRGYSGDYVFDLEQQYLKTSPAARLILLTEEFRVSKHFVDDGHSFDITKREGEQKLFLAAFKKSAMPDKRIICVTDLETGGFKSKEWILREALAGN